MELLWPGPIEIDQAAGCLRQFQQASKSRLGPCAHQ